MIASIKADRGAGLEQLTAAPRSFIATFNPDNPLLELTDGDGNPVDNYIWIDQETTVSVTLAGEATLVAPYVQWNLSPEPPAEVNVDNNTVSFTVPVPLPFRPWIFKLVYDAEGAGGNVKGVQSQSIFLGRPANADLRLIYETETGNFTLREDGSPTGILLESQLVLVNILPGSFSMTLVADPEALVSFTPANPLSWLSGQKPSWFRCSLSEDNKTLSGTVDEGAAGQLAACQFSIEYNGLTVLSPDPVIVNAPIGDGSD